MKLYPLFADLSHRAVLVVGGGAVAERKIAALLGAQAQVTVNAPVLTPQLRRWVSEGRIAHRPDAFKEGWLERIWLVVAATSDRETNALVATLAGLRRIFVNVVDDATLSSFHVPAVVDRAPLMIAISSGGEAPMLARLLRERLERMALSELMSALMSSLLAVLEGKHRKAARLMEEADAAYEPEIVMYFARHYARMGMAERAVECLRSAMKAGFVCAPETLEGDAWLAAVRESGEYGALKKEAKMRVERARAGMLKVG